VGASPDVERRWAVGVLWFIPLLWSVNLLVARVAPGVITPHVLAFGRWALASVLLLLLARQEWRGIAAALREHPGRYLVLGACGMWICGAWVYLAGQSTSALNLSLIYSSAPVMIAVGAGWWLGERLRGLQRLGVLAALLGVVHVIVRGDWARLSEVVFVAGDLWVLAAAVAWAAFALLQKRWQAPLSATAQLAAMALGGVAVLLPFAAWELTLADTPALGWSALGLVVATAVFPGVGAYWIYSWTQRILGASRVGMTLYLAPLYTAAVAALVLGEPMGWYHLSGGALILGGVALVTLGKR
jgi:drug/metabolite transporter (DMT)-like permease